MTRFQPSFIPQAPDVVLSYQGATWNAEAKEVRAMGYLKIKKNSFLTLCIVAAVGNFAYQAVMGGDFMKALEWTYFQWAFALAVWVSSWGEE